MIYVSHDMETVKRLCKNALWIKDNHAYMYGTATEVGEAYKKECEEELLRQG